MRRPPYIILERPNHLRDLWDKLRIPLLQLRIFPKIMPWPSIWIQLPSGVEGFFPYLPQQTQNLPKKRVALAQKGAQGAQALPQRGSGSAPLQNSFFSGFSNGKRLVLHVKWLLFFQTSLWGVLSVFVMSLEARHGQDGSMMFLTLADKMRHLQHL